MQFDLVTPEQLLVSREASYVQVPGSEGSFGVLEGHQPTISTLNPGVVEVESEGTKHQYCVGYGFVDVTGEKVTVLAEEAIAKADIDVEHTTAEFEAQSEKLKAAMSAGNATDVEQLQRKVACLEARLMLANS